MEKLDTLKKRLDKIGIDIEFAANYPWIYIWKINGKRLKETFKANHGFTVGFLPVRSDRPFYFTDLNEIFKLIRKYCKVWSLVHGKSNARVCRFVHKRK